MTAESDGEFNDRRAIEERVLAERTTDPVRSIPHGQLAKLHAAEAASLTVDHQSHDEAPEVAALDGSVTLTSATGEITTLTPDAANLTSDRLQARARDATKEQSNP